MGYSSDFGHRPEFRRNGDRKLEVVRGRKPYGAATSYHVPAPSRSRSPEYSTSRGGGGGGGGGGGSFWCFSDPEMKRKKRVASYKAYSVEGKIKASFRRGIKWIKAKCSELVHGH